MGADGNLRELQRKLEQCRRLSFLAGDAMTKQRLAEFRDELAEALINYPSRREHISEDAVRVRAHDLWEQHGCPAGRDDEFWVRAERELIEETARSSRA
jgi:hypothetical protein